MIKLCLVLWGLGILLSGCMNMNATAPKGFAQYDKGKDFRAVSSEGILYRVRKEENYPKADLSFWKEALKKRMTDSGYTFLSDASIKANATEGYLLELAAPFGQLDYAYLIAIFVHGNSIYIAEATGEVTLLKKDREVIVEAMRQILWN